MGIGYPLNTGTINSRTGQLTAQLRAVCDAMLRFQEGIVALGPDDPQAGPGSRQKALTDMGYSLADAADVVRVADYLGNVAGVYFGTVPQGDPGVLFNFDTALAVARGIA